ncbi:MAG TPA: hypothetical protein VET69_12405, partial [Terriglobales bacterium]|nr:hypothetical protein [Terriglobales bacterium]
MQRRNFLITAGAMLASKAIASPNETPGVLRLPLRSRVEAFKGSGVWQEVRLEQALPLAQTAIIICDMWDNHWCTGAAKRVEILARKMTPVVDGARSHGVQIIHAPSETMQFYAEAPQRRLMTELAKVPAPESLSLTDPPLPIDDSGGGCDTPDKF